MSGLIKYALFFWILIAVANIATYILDVILTP